MTIQNLAEIYGISIATLRRYANKEGVDVWDPHAVDAHIASKQRIPQGYRGLKLTRSLLNIKRALKRQGLNS